MRTFGSTEAFIVDDRPRAPQIDRPMPIKYKEECDIVEREYEPIGKTFVQPHPIVSTIGVFADDPFWDDFIEALAKSDQEQKQAYAETE